MRRIKSLLLDLCLIACATILALLLRDNLEYSSLRFAALIPYLALTLAVSIVVLPLARVDRTLWRFSGLSEYWRLAGSCLLIVLIAVMISFAINRGENVARSLPIIQALLMITMLVLVRLSMRVHRFRHVHGHLSDPVPPGVTSETVLVVGLNSIAELFLQAAAEHATDRIAIAGVLGRNERQTGQIFRKHRVLGMPEEIDSVIRELQVHGVFVDRVVVAVAFDHLSPLAQKQILDLESSSEIKIDFFAERLAFVQRQPEAQHTAPATGDGSTRDRVVTVRMDGAAAHFAKVGPAMMGEENLLASLRRPYWRIKRGFDIGLALIGLALTLPVMAVIYVATALSLGHPVVFWQQRPGRYGRPFKVYKFRTMLGAHDASGARIPDDLRETGFGRFLRATRLDELPQLFNILTGHMSFVGPRPLLNVDQLEQFKDRMLVRPGLTGWAQVNGGKTVSALDKMALDMWYIRNASLRLDLQIIAMTIKMVAFGERANPTAVSQAWTELNGSSVGPAE